VASKKQRFQEFLRRLELSPPAPTLGEARRLIDATLNAVEDEMSGVPYNPTTWLTDGRTYPVQDDNIRGVPGQPNVKRARSKDHNIYLGKNGAICIVQISTHEVLLDKPGEDGNLISAGVR
jgi:hypothetical protein